MMRIQIPRRTENRDSKTKAAENGEPQLHNQRGRLTTLDVINEAENGEPRSKKIGGKYLEDFT